MSANNQLKLRELNAQEQKEYMQRIKSGEAPVLISNIMIRMPSFVSCQNNGDEIFLETKLGHHVIYQAKYLGSSVLRVFNDICKLLEAIELEDYESMTTLQNYIKMANRPPKQLKQ